MIAEIQPHEVHARYQREAAVLLIDVREAEEFANAAAPYARTYPLSALNPVEILSELQLNPGVDQVPLYFICAGGVRSHRAAELFRAAGYTAVYNVSGGMYRWFQQGLPLR